MPVDVPVHTQQPWESTRRLPCAAPARLGFALSLEIVEGMPAKSAFALRVRATPSYPRAVFSAADVRCNQCNL